MAAADVADLEAKVRDEVRSRRLPVEDVVVPRWRDEAGLLLGPVSQALSKGRADAPRWKFLLTMASRTLDRNPVKSVKSMVTDVATEFRPNLAALLGYQLLGDVATYARRRARIHEVLRAALGKCGNKVVAVGHSLGGVALVDLMAERPAENVTALVTVGSQSALLYTLDALEGLPYKAARPFTPWLNVWDSRDHLSFFARDVFKLESDDTWPIVDVEVDSDEPLREAHSAYWVQEGTWAAIELALRISMGLKSVRDAHTTGHKLVEVVAKVRNADVADTYRLLDAIVDESDAATAAVVAEVRQWLQKEKKTTAKHDLLKIRRGEFLRSEVEQTGAAYFDVGRNPYIFIAGTINEARVQRLAVDYLPLRPDDWNPDESPWLVAFAESSSTISDRTRAALLTTGIIVLTLDEQASSLLRDLLAKV
jgi:hypothetical protein